MKGRDNNQYHRNFYLFTFIYPFLVIHNLSHLTSFCCLTQKSTKNYLTHLFYFMKY